MGKYILTIVFILGLATTTPAQDSYYYCDGNKVPLTIHDSKIVAIAPKDSDITLSPSDGFVVSSIISDSNSAIKVYGLPSKSTMSKVKSLASSLESINILSCYRMSNGSGLIPDGYINVQLYSTTDYSKLQAAAEENSCEIVEQNEFMPLWFNLRVLNSSHANPVDAANAIYETGLFASSSPSFYVDALDISYDPNVYEQWGLYNSEYEGYDISISEAWNYATGRGIKIAIIDQGIELTHQGLAANIYSLSYDTETNSSPSNVYTSRGHGTHCAGIAAAVRNNGIQIAGVAPDAKLMSVSSSFVGSNLTYKLANGINWAWENGADIISCSWWCAKNDMIGKAIDNAVTKGREGKGCVFVNSAGNYSYSHPTYNISFPGDYSEDVIAVTNMTKDGDIASSSCYGQNVLVIAPGTNILSTTLNNSIGYKTGTSMACPHVSGVAALILERNPSLNAAKVREIIAENAEKVGAYPYDTTKKYGTWNEKYGYGLVNAYNAVANTPRN